MSERKKTRNSQEIMNNSHSENKGRDPRGHIREQINNSKRDMSYTQENDNSKPLYDSIPKSTKSVYDYVSWDTIKIIVMIVVTLGALYYAYTYWRDSKAEKASLKNKNEDESQEDEKMRDEKMREEREKHEQKQESKKSEGVDIEILGLKAEVEKYGGYMTNLVTENNKLRNGLVNLYNNPNIRKMLELGATSEARPGEARPSDDTKMNDTKSNDTRSIEARSNDTKVNDKTNNQSQNTSLLPSAGLLANAVPLIADALSDKSPDSKEELEQKIEEESKINMLKDDVNNEYENLPPDDYSDVSNVKSMPRKSRERNMREREPRDQENRESETRGNENREQRQKKKSNPKSKPKEAIRFVRKPK